jgi:hypothetical protein
MKHGNKGKGRRPMTKAWLLPMPPARVRSISLKYHLALVAMRGGHGDLEMLRRLQTAVYLVFLLSDLADVPDAQIALCVEAERVLERAEARCALDAADSPVLERLVTLQDDYFATLPRYRLSELWQHVSACATSGVKLPVAAALAAAARGGQRRLTPAGAAVCPLVGQPGQIQRIRTPDPGRAVAMVAQFVAGVRMQEDVERAVIQHEPRHDGVEVLAPERELVRPDRMRADRLLVEAAELQPRAELLVDDLAEGPGGIAMGGVEIDVRVPAFDGGGIEQGHDGSRAGGMRGIVVRRG